MAPRMSDERDGHRLAISTAHLLGSILQDIMDIRQLSAKFITI
jgi:hypothetical protein